jgi:hypothetical protein
MRTLCSLQQNCSSSYMWGSALYFHVEHTCMTASFDWEGRFGPQIRLHLFIEVSMPMSAVRGHACKILLLLLWFSDWILKLFWRALPFVFNLIIKYFYQIKVGLRNVKYWLVNRPFVLHWENKDNYTISVSMFLYCIHVFPLYYTSSCNTAKVSVKHKWINKN